MALGMSTSTTSAPSAASASSAASNAASVSGSIGSSPWLMYDRSTPMRSPRTSSTSDAA